MKNILQLLQWRYATKKMDSTKKVSDEKLNTIIESVRLTATSSGLQPYELLVITNPETRQKIQDIAWSQTQITEASHLLVFAAWDNYTVERINMMFDLTNDIRGIKNQGWEDYRMKLLEAYPNRDPEANFQHAARQSYIGLGTALLAAAEQEVDCTPMEGFDADALDKILDLRSKGLRSTIILPIGYREASNDWLVNLTKVRRGIESFVRFIK